MYGDQQDPRLQQLLAMMMGGRGGITPASFLQQAPPGLSPPGASQSGGQYGGPGLGQYVPTPQFGAPQRNGPQAAPDMGNVGGGGGGMQNIFKLVQNLRGTPPSADAMGGMSENSAAPQFGASTEGGVTDWANNSGLGRVVGLNSGGSNNFYARALDMVLGHPSAAAQAARSAASTAASHATGAALSTGAGAGASALGTASQAAIDSQLPGAAGAATTGAAATTGETAAGTGVIGHILSWLSFL